MEGITEAQMDVIRNYNRLDAESRGRVELREGLHEMRLAIQQVLAKEITSREDMFQLDEAIPGMTRRFSKAMGLSEAEFSEQLQQGVVLAPSLKGVLQKLLADPFLNG